MCGILGVLNLVNPEPVSRETLIGMLGMIQHRGPDGYGLYRDDWVGLGNARLSIIDLSTGDQPIGNEDGNLWIVFNGEIFNYLELRPDLEARGHRFTTQGDTEVLLHLYEEYGPACLERLNGQFSLAIWDRRRRELFLARDRLGTRPLFYTCLGRQLLFASEIKSILAYPGMQAAIDPAAVTQALTFWSALPPQTLFQGIQDLPAGHYLRVPAGGQIQIQRYWEPDYPSQPVVERPDEEYLEELESLLKDAAALRLRADVPVGAYLSGGIDSSVIAALTQQVTGDRLETFSIAFSDPNYDESSFQATMAGHLGTRHHQVTCDQADIGEVFPDLVWHTESILLRTAPAPMYLLARLVHQNGFKVILTGEGADEMLGGYDIFKETLIRRFWAREPDSTLRPRLLKSLYPEIAAANPARWAYWKAFFQKNLTDTGSVFYSHDLRWRNTARLWRFLAQPPNPQRRLETECLSLPSGFATWQPLSQAEYLEIVTFLSPYLLASQGDRPAMAHSVEGRYPFLDHRVVAFCSRLPAHVQVRGLTEKWLLRRLGQKNLPPEIWRRRKRPYRAPIQGCFFPTARAPYAAELLSGPAVTESGIFDPQAVGSLAAKAAGQASLSETEEMALTAVLSLQLVYRLFIRDFRKRLPEHPLAGKPLKLVDYTSPMETPDGSK